MEANQRELECIECVTNILEPDPFLRSLRMVEPDDEGDSTSVSPTKTFRQLWKDHGLHEMGVAWYAKKQQCMQEWVRILYSTDLNLEEIVQEERMAQIEFRKDVSNSGIRFNLAHPVDMLPEKIDEIYGPYA